MDPIRQLTTPVAEVRQQAPVQVDSYGESWVVIDGIEAKVPSIKAAKVLLAQQDKVRAKIRAELDASGVRDRTVQEQLVLDGKLQFDLDGKPIMVEMLVPGNSGANVLQIGGFPDADGLFENATRVQLHVDRAFDEQRLAERKIAERAAKKRGPVGRLLHRVNCFLRGDRT